MSAQPEALPTAGSYYLWRIAASVHVLYVFYSEGYGGWVFQFVGKTNSLPVEVTRLRFSPAPDGAGPLEGVVGELEGPFKSEKAARVRLEKRGKGSRG
jgi:hypothetical protein